jgi:hypothetical protein
MVLGMVGAKAATSAASVIGCLASTLLAGEGRDERNTTRTTTAITPAKADKTHVERLSAELVGAGRALVPFLRFMRTFARRTKGAMDE